MGLEASDLARWTRFAAKGGIGKCVALCDCVAESADDLMFLKDDDVTVLFQIPDTDGLFLGYCKGVVGQFNGADVSRNPMTKWSSVSATSTKSPSPAPAPAPGKPQPQPPAPSPTTSRPASISTSTSRKVAQSQSLERRTSTSPSTSTSTTHVISPLASQPQHSRMNLYKRDGSLT